MPRRYLVVGTGLIGTSIAMGLRAAGHTVLLADTDADALQVAITASGGQAWDGSDNVDVAVVAPPPATVPTVMGELATAVEDLPRYAQDGYSLVSSALITKLDALAKEIEAQKVSFKGWATPGATVNSADCTPRPDLRAVPRRLPAPGGTRTRVEACAAHPKQRHGGCGLN